MLSSVKRRCPHCGRVNAIDLADPENVAIYRIIYRDDEQEIHVRCVYCKEDFVIIVRDAEAEHES